MNSFGRIFRVSIFGESHGAEVGVVINGCPAGLPISERDFSKDLKRRQGGTLPGTTPRKEPDQPQFCSGLFEGRTTGSPLTITFENTNIKSKDYDKIRNTPRPGHADLVAQQKYGGYQDPRGGGHFSGRLTAPLVAAGVVAKKLLPSIKITAELLQAGASEQIEDSVKAALDAGDSVGGLVECQAVGLPSGLGEPFFDSLESLISHLAFSIPAIKGIEFGLGFRSAAMRGSDFHDDIANVDGSTVTNNAGGINGGVSNGNPLVFRVAVKPTSSIRAKKMTVDLETGAPTEISVAGRHDACIALRVPPVLEAITALVLVDLMLIEQKLTRIWENKNETG